MPGFMGVEGFFPPDRGGGIGSVTESGAPLTANRLLRSGAGGKIEAAGNNGSSGDDITMSGAIFSNATLAFRAAASNARLSFQSGGGLFHDGVGFQYLIDVNDVHNRFLSVERARAGTVQTSGTTQATVVSFTPAINTVYYVQATIAGRKSDGSESAMYLAYAGFAVNGSGTVTQIGTTQILGTPPEVDAAYVGTIDTDGTLIRVRAAGNTGDTVDWRTVLIDLARA